MKYNSEEPDISLVIDKRRHQIADREDLLSLLIRLAILAIVGYLLLTQVFLITRYCGENMFPAMKDGDLVIGFRLRLEDLHRNDVVVYTLDEKQYFGRVVAAGGDVVTLREDGALIVNGTTQTEEILYPTFGGDVLEYPYRVADGSVFVLGDYRTRTKDSRDFGAIPLDSVEGRVITLFRRRGL